MQILLDGAGDNLIIELLHELIELGVEALSESRIFEVFETLPVMSDVGGMENEVISAKEIVLELTEPPIDHLLGVVCIHDDASEHENRILLVDGRESMIP